MPVKRIKASDLPTAYDSRTTLFERMKEWRELREIVMEGLVVGEALEIDLSAESLLLTEQTETAQTLTRFSARFRKLYPPGEWRYEMFTKRGKIWVRGKSQHRAALLKQKASPEHNVAGGGEKWLTV